MKTVKNLQKLNKTLKNAQRDGRSDGPTDGQTDQPTDKVTYRVACTQLKIFKEINAQLISLTKSFF